MEDNDIEALPDDMFHCLPNLRWLDIRNNRITEIPTSIKYHDSLETLLMQNNKIKSLPVELGTVATIKNLQILPNPIDYPALEVVNKGTQAVMDYLQNDYKNKDPAYSKYLLKQEMMKMIDKELQKPAPKIKPTTADLLNKELSNLKLNAPFNPGTTSEYQKRLKEVSFDVCSPLEVNKYVNPFTQRKKDLQGLVENRRLNLPLKKLPFVGKVDGCKKFSKINAILKKLLDSLKEAKHKDKYNIIERILELRRTFANIQKFKYEYRYKSRLSYAKHAGLEVEKPFGTYQEFEKMISRYDLNLFKKYPNRKPRKIRRGYKPKINIAAKISELIKSLDGITLVNPDDTNLDPGDRKKKIADDIDKISEIQKALKKLQFMNSKNI